MVTATHMVVTIYIGEPDYGQQSHKKTCHREKSLCKPTLRDPREESPCKLTPEGNPREKSLCKPTSESNPRDESLCKPTLKSNPREKVALKADLKALQRGVTLVADPDHYNGPPPSIGLHLGTSVEARRVYSQMYGY